MVGRFGNESIQSLSHTNQLTNHKAPRTPRSSSVKTQRDVAMITFERYKYTRFFLLLRRLSLTTFVLTLPPSFSHYHKKALFLSREAAILYDNPLVELVLSSQE